MDNVADQVDFEQLWACAPAEDLRRAAELARITFDATAVTIVSHGAAPITRWISKDSTAATPAIHPTDLAETAADDTTSMCAPLLTASGLEAGQLRVTATPSRAWSERDRRVLADLAAQLMRQIELSRALSLKSEPATDVRATLLEVADRIPGLVFERRKIDAGRSTYTFFGSGKTELPAVRQMMGSGIAGLNFVHRDDRDAVRAAILRSNLEETDLDLTFRIKDLDRKIRWVRSQSVVRREADGTVSWDGLCFDVTDLVAAREDAARASKDVLLSSIDRQLRDPLKAVIGLAQLMKNEDQAARVVSHARNIQLAAEALIQTIDRMLGRSGDEAASDGRSPPDTTRRSLALPKADADGTRGTTGIRILLADDLDLNRKLVSDMLGFEGHIVDCVADGADAVQAARRQDYDLILMDMIMPGMDGLAATRAIRALPPPASGVPIVALTANAGKEHIEQCLAAGMNAALAKPMSLDELANVVTTWTRGRQAA